MCTSHTVPVTIRKDITPAMRTALATKWTLDEQQRAKEKGLRQDCVYVAKQTVGIIKAPTKSFDAVKVCRLLQNLTLNLTSWQFSTKEALQILQNLVLSLRSSVRSSSEFR